MTQGEIVLDILRAGPQRRAQIVAALPVTFNEKSFNGCLSHLLDTGRVEKSGRVGAFLYHLPTKKAETAKANGNGAANGNGHSDVAAVAKAFDGAQQIIETVSTNAAVQVLKAKRDELSRQIAILDAAIALF